MPQLKADEIAKTEKLNRKKLKDSIYPGMNSIYFDEKKEELLSDLGAISSTYDLDERIIIYCFIRLDEEGKVERGNFYKSFQDNRMHIFKEYIKHYEEDLKVFQERFW